MPFLPPPPAAETPAAEIDYAAAPQDRLFDHLRAEAAGQPGKALDLASLVRNDLRRDQLRKQAFLTACATDRKSAIRHLPAVIDRPWIEEVPLLDAIAIAADLANTPLARRLVLAAALRNPSLAVRTAPDFLSLPFGREIFELAALAVPGDAVLVASGISPSAKDAFATLDASANPSIRFLAMLAHRNEIDPALRERAAVFHREILGGSMTLDQALTLAAKPAAYFHALVGMRLSASKSTPARQIDRLLEAQALPIARSVNDGKSAAQSPDLRAMSARDVFLLLAYGRAEEGDAGFPSVFDQVFLPKLRTERLSMLQLLEPMAFLQLRPFVAAALANQRLDAFLAACAERERGVIVAAFVEGLDRSDQPLSDLVSAAEIVENLGPPARLKEVATAIAANFAAAQTRQARAMYGLLDALAARRLPSAEGPWKAIAAPYASTLLGVDTLLRSPLFPRDLLCVQRHFFYNDADGVESYESFRAFYESDASWKAAEHDGWVRLTGLSEGRRIDIFANIPINLNTAEHASESEAALRRQQRVSQALSSANLEPTVIVHRGHSYHVDKTLDYLNSSARLVFLGSCHGMGKMDTVMERAPAAQVIATSGVGTAGINDPMLKSLNDALLRGSGDIRWPEFWQTQTNRFGRSRIFTEYVPPHKNTAADILRAYYAALDGEEPRPTQSGQ